MKFLRTDTKHYKRLGRKKKRKWRKARGIHNKIRKEIRGKPKKVKIGYKKAKKEEILIIRSLRDVKKINSGQLVKLGRFGKKKREEIIKKINEIGGKILK